METRYKVVVCQTEQLENELGDMANSSYDIDRYEQYKDGWIVIGRRSL